MAKGRFISKEIARDTELNLHVSLKADYLFSRMIPHLDVEGRMEGHPVYVKATAVPMRDEFDADTVRECLSELSEAGLIRWYEVGGKQYIEFPAFEDHQKGLRKEREAESKCPPAKSNGATPLEDSGVDPEDSGSRDGGLPQSRAPAEVEVQGEGEAQGEGSSGSSLPTVETSPPGEPGEESTPDSEPEGESDGPPYPTSREELREWVDGTPKPASREQFASRHFVRGVWTLWIGDDPPEKRPGPNYDMGAELRKLRQRHGAATNEELAQFLAGVILRRDQGEYGGVEPGEGMTLGFVDALNSDRDGRSEWSLAKEEGRELAMDTPDETARELIEGVGV